MIKLNCVLWATLFIFFFGLILTSFIENGGKLTGTAVYCPSVVPCPNPFYNVLNSDLKDIEFIPPGETIGTTPGIITKSVPLFSLFLLVIGVLLEIFLRRERKNENRDYSKE